MEQGLIFDIERFSTKDGPGIRTVVFFKGCNMSCLWCHNPEGIHGAPELLCRPEMCIACESCAAVCPEGLHSFGKGGHVFYQERCNQCLQCTQVCFSGALRRCGREMTVEQVMEQILPDKPLYDRTGGGVTLSGGEVMVQGDFAARLAAACAGRGIRCAIETNLSLPWSRYEQILPFVDMVFADIKHPDSQAHRQWTGIGNEEILSNLERLDSSGVRYAIRTPVIPGVNDTEQAIGQVARRLAGKRNLAYYELLKYNPLGGSKGLPVHPPEQKRFPVPTRELMGRLAASASEYVPTRIEGSRYTSDDTI